MLPRVKPVHAVLFLADLLAVVVRLAFGPLAGPRDLWPWIQVTYLELGANIAAGRGYWLSLGPDALSIQSESARLLPLASFAHDFTHLYRPIEYYLPGYAFLIAPAIALTGRTDWGVVQTFTGLLDGLAGPLLAYTLVHRGGAGQASGIVAAFLYASSPQIARMVAEVMPDSLSALLTVLPLALVAAGRSSRWCGWAAGLAGLSIGLAGAVRGEIVALLPLLAVLVCLMYGRHWKVRLRLASLIVVGWLVGTVPLTVFWSQVYGYPAVSRPGVGIRLWEGIGDFVNPWGVEARDEAAGSLLEQHGLAYGTAEGDAFLVREALAHFREAPLFFARSVAVRGRDVAQFGINGWGDWSLSIPFGSGQPGLFATIFASLLIIGAFASLRLAPLLFGLLACLWISRVVPFSLLEVQPRDLVPLYVAYGCWVACALVVILRESRRLALFARESLERMRLPGHRS